MTEQMPPLSRGQLLEQQSAEERLVMAAYRRTFEERIPPPQPPEKIDLRGLGYEFWLYFVQSLFSIALAAMRTADAFYFIGYAVAGNKFYASGESILSVVVVELGMVVFAAIWAQKRYRNKETTARAAAEAKGQPFRSSKSVEVSTAVIVVGLVLMALISMAAGLHQSIRIIENIDQKFVQFLSYGLGVTIGVGITIIAVIGGDILGQQLAIVTAAYQDREADYQDALDAYQEEFEYAWARSDERRVVRADVRSAARVQSTNGPLSGPLSGQSVDFSQGNAFGQGRRPAVTTERVYQYLDQILQTENRVASFAEVRSTLNIPKSTASKLRLQWLADRGISEVAGENGHSED